jgi:hypothetical protein
VKDEGFRFRRSWFGSAARKQRFKEAVRSLISPTMLRAVTGVVPLEDYRLSLTFSGKSALTTATVLLVALAIGAASQSGSVLMANSDNPARPNGLLLDDDAGNPKLQRGSRGVFLEDAPGYNAGLFGHAGRNRSATDGPKSRMSPFSRGGSMTTITSQRPGRGAVPVSDVPPLEPGDRLTRDEFERRYAAMPELKKAELIEGVVYMPSPVRVRRHGGPHAKDHWLAGQLRSENAGRRGGR